MNSTPFNFPPQRLTFKDKSKEDFKWAKETIKNISQNFAPRGKAFNNMIANYDLYNNKINKKDFEYSCELLAIKPDTFPELEVYNKTANKINVLLSEEAKRPFEYKAILINSSGIKSKIQERQDVLRQMAAEYSQRFLESQDADIKEELEKVSNLNFLSSKEKSANSLLDYFYRAQDIAFKKNDSFKHGLLAGIECVWVGIENSNPVIKVPNPLGYFEHKSGDTKYGEDGLFAGYQTYMTVGEVLDKLGEEMNEEQLDRIEKYYQGSYRGEAAAAAKDMKYYHEEFNIAKYFNEVEENSDILRGQYSANTNSEIKVTHLEWKSQKKVGFLSYIDPDTGEDTKDIVGEEFVVPNYAIKETNEVMGKKITTYTWDIYTLEWGWLPEVWEGIMLLDDIFVKVGPKRFQYRSVDNPHKVKLGYHSVTYSATNSEPVSVMDRMKPLQYLFTVLMYKLKKLIAADKLPAMGFDTSMIDPKLGFDKTMYYLEELGIDFYNSLEGSDKQGASGRSGKLGNTVNRSTMQNIQGYIQLIDAIDAQIGDVAGVNKQREGQVAPTEAVTNVQTQITQSSVITELMFQLHFKLWERVLSTLLEICKTAWPNIKVLQTILDDMSLMTIQYNPDELLDEDFGIFLTNTSREHMVLHQLQQLGLTLMQNDKVDLGSYISMISTSSLEAVKEEIKRSEKKRQEMQQQMMQQEQQQQAQLEEMKEASKQADREFELEKMRVAHEYKMEEIEVESFKFVDEQDSDSNAIPDQLEVEKFKQQRDKENFESMFNLKKHNDEMAIKGKELDIKQQIANKPTPKPAAKKK